MTAAVSQQSRDETGGTKIDVSLLTFVDDLMDTLIEDTLNAMKLRDAANDKKNLHRSMNKSGVSWSQAKNIDSSSEWGLTPERTWPNVAQEPCWCQVAFLRQSSTLDAGWKGDGQAQ